MIADIAAFAQIRRCHEFIYDICLIIFASSLMIIFAILRLRHVMLTPFLRHFIGFHADFSPP